MKSISLGYVDTGLFDLVDRKVQDVCKSMIFMGKAGGVKELKCVYVYLVSHART